MNVLFKMSHLTITSAILSAGIFLFVCSSSVGITGEKLITQENLPPVTIEYGTRDQATSYTASSEDCSITWIAYNAGPNQGVIKHSPRCAAPMELQLSLLTRICTVFFGHDKDARTYRTLFWGGLEAERKPAFEELQLRLALAAYRSPGWDVKKGKPKSGDINGFIKNLANEEPIYPELKELFRRFDRNITLASVEKVRVLEAGKLSIYHELKQQGVAASDKLPFDCMAWFSLSARTP